MWPRSSQTKPEPAPRGVSLGLEQERAAAHGGVRDVDDRGRDLPEHLDRVALEVEQVVRDRAGVTAPAASGSLPARIAAARSAQRRGGQRARERAPARSAGTDAVRSRAPPSGARRVAPRARAGCAAHSPRMAMRALRIARRGAALALEQLELPEPGPGEVRLRVSACGVAAPICICSTASCPTRAGRSCRAIRSWAASIASAPAFASTRWATAWACPGSAAPVARAGSARASARISAMRPCSRAASATAASRSSRWPTLASASRSRRDFDDVAAAPLLCAGLIGYRCLRLAGDAATLGPLWLRRRGARRDPGGAPSGPARVRVHAARRCRRAALRARARRRVGRPLRRGAARAARRRDPVRARGRARAGRAARGRQGRRP